VSPVQTVIFEFVRERCAIGLPPTIKEIAEAVRLKDHVVEYQLGRLIRFGKIGRNPTEKRGLFVPGGTNLQSVSTIELKLELERRGVTLAPLQSEQAFGREKTCAADTCGEVVKIGMFFCKQHWFSLPKSLRTEVLETHYSRNRVAFQDAFTRARDLIDGCAGPIPARVRA
jgi:hypothetical protein